MDVLYSIGELAEIAGVSARTLRYYDQEGLLKPSCVNEAGYRFYGDQEVNLLQQILFYRKRGLELNRIRQIIYESDFDITGALEEHLSALEEQKEHIEDMIRMVRCSIMSMKGECQMSDREKFEAFKQRAVGEHERQYGREAREKYGDAEVDAAQRKVLNMSEEDWERFQNLGKEIRTRLNEAVSAGLGPDSEEAERIVMLHKEWLGMTWKKYTEEAHRAMGNLYISDERFKLYYDRDMPGCAEFLEQAIRHRIKTGGE